jgi:hypothetical protein
MSALCQKRTHALQQDCVDRPTALGRMLSGKRKLYNRDVGGGSAERVFRVRRQFLADAECAKKVAVAVALRVDHWRSPL